MTGLKIVTYVISHAALLFFFGLPSLSQSISGKRSPRRCSSCYLLPCQASYPLAYVRILA